MTSGGTTNSAIPGARVPDGGWGWIIVLASFMIHFIMDGITYSMGDIFLHPMMKKFPGVGRVSISTTWAILPAVTLGSGPIATVFTNTYGCRKVTIVGAILASIGFFMSGFWANIYFYYLSIGVIGGLGLGLIYLPAIVSVGYYFEQKRSLAMGIAVCGSGLGTLVFPVVMERIIGKPWFLGFVNGLKIEAAIIVICVIFGALMVPLPQESSEIRRRALKERAKAKRLALQSKETTSPNDEQRNQLLPTNRERDIPLQKGNILGRESTAVVPGEQQHSDGDNHRTSLPRIDETSIKIIDPTDKTPKKSIEQFEEEISSEPSVVISRKDAVYQGSLHNIALFNDDKDEYHRQMITTTDDVLLKPEVKASFVAQLAKEIDFSLLKDGAFALFAISNFLTSLGFNVPYNFANDLAKDAKVIDAHRSWPIMAIGIANCFGRVVIGILGDRKWINRLYLYNIALVIAGASVLFAPFCNDHIGTHIAYAAFFGFFSGGYVGLTSIIVVDLVGVDKLSSAFGVILLIQGVAVALGTPIVGEMRDKLEGTARPYLWPYLIFGGFILISGVILFGIPALQRRKERQQQPTQHQLDMGVLSYSKENINAPERPQQQL
ncbi:unnamed protein product [Adineta steineri]|uniref:Major facilitator superfamily (MFS) profile domain-containing protein n=1 Tax=Adineta steineri TaxID=433720 RepID=A0A815Z1A6_9BILA|nr:unnamed protein product [Adineta steineri]